MYDPEKYAPAPEGRQHVVFLLVLGEELFEKKNRRWLLSIIIAKIDQRN